MAAEMRAADLIVCRAGAMTLAEIAAIGRPAVLIPLPTAADDHQRRNAEVFQAAGAAVVLDQQGLTGTALAAQVLGLAEDQQRRHAMAAASRAFARPDAARLVVDRMMSLARRGTPGAE
jgi:UDP-N-acetylglucosamine--N-acetylmuramyl-(pentapeptide) pyrophosphoryl-undecaprenol N-acetylglucosamine transferase